MMSLRLRLAGAVVALAITAASCGDSSVTAPPVASLAPDSSQADLIGILGPVTRPLGLLTCRPMAPAWGSAVIGPRGGAVQVGPHVLRIPAGALDAPVTITGYAAGDDVNRVRFWPEGLEFERSAALSMSYANCDVLTWLLPKRIAYIDGSQGILYYLLSLDNFFTKTVTGKVDHFSEYAVSW